MPLYCVSVRARARACHCTVSVRARARACHCTVSVRARARACHCTVSVRARARACHCTVSVRARARACPLCEISKLGRLYACKVFEYQPYIVKSPLVSLVARSLAAIL